MSSHFEKEILEQAGMFRAKHTAWTEAAAACSEAYSEKKQKVLLGRGSSGNACTFAAYLWGLQTRRQAIEFRPWLATQPREQAPDWGDSVAYAYSVSGRSTDVAQAASWLRAHGAAVIGITNDEQQAEETHIGRASDALFRLQAGPELAVPASKTFSAQLFASAALCGLPLADAAMQTADCFDEITASERADSLARFIEGGRQVAWLARGPSIAAALDAALKLQETAAIPSVGYSSAEFLHGPVGSFGPQDRAIIFLDGDAAFDNHDSVIAALLNRKTPVFVIGGQKGGEELRGSTLPVPFPDQVWPRATILVLLAQLAALRLAEQKGMNPDAPSGLRKVTQT